MRTKILRIGIFIGKQSLNFIYFFMKLFPTKNKISLLSRQADSESIDFKYISKEIVKRNANIEIKELCKGKDKR